MTRQLAQALAVAVRRIDQLSNQSIVTKDTEGELDAARQFVSHTVVQHANELIGTWIAMENEYSPLVQGLTGLLRRVNTNTQFIKPSAKEPKAVKAAECEAQNEKAAASVISGVAFDNKQ